MFLTFITSLYQDTTAEAHTYCHTGLQTHSSTALRRWSCSLCVWGSHALTCCWHIFWLPDAPWNLLHGCRASQPHQHLWRQEKKIIAYWVTTHLQNRLCPIFLYWQVPCKVGKGERFPIKLKISQVSMVIHSTKCPNPNKYSILGSMIIIVWYKGKLTDDRIRYRNFQPHSVSYFQTWIWQLHHLNYCGHVTLYCQGRIFLFCKY